PLVLGPTVGHGVEEIRVLAAVAEEDALADTPGGRRRWHVDGVRLIAATAVALIAQTAPDLNRLQRRLRIPEALRGLLHRNRHVPLAHLRLGHLEEAAAKAPPLVTDVQGVLAGWLLLRRRFARDDEAIGSPAGRAPRRVPAGRLDGLRRRSGGAAQEGSRARRRQDAGDQQVAERCWGGHTMHLLTGCRHS